MDDNDKTISIEKINDVFKLPITFNDNVKTLDNHIINDLELVETINNDTNDNDNDNIPIYHKIFKPDNNVSKEILKQMSKYYVADTSYLKDTQKLIKNISNDNYNTITNKYGVNIDDVVSSYLEIKNETAFCEKYLYIDWSFAKFLNSNPLFLQLMSLYNIVSPILSLCLPIIVLIIPFFVIKIKGIKLTIAEYIDILKMLISNHAMFKVFTQFNDVDNGQKLYLILSSAFYLFSIYQNMLVCIRFYSNMQRIHSYLFKIQKYLEYTLNLYDYHFDLTNELTNYKKFNSDFLVHKKVLVFILNRINLISPLTLSFSKFNDIGYVMATFYDLHNNDDYNTALLHSFGFHGYMNLLVNIDKNKLKSVQFCRKTNKNRNIVKIKKMYYPAFIDDATMKTNDCDLKTNMIITGPNASGKTTTIKSLLLNIILSQQIGFGCFNKFKLTTFDYLHCYLNIPDTSGRDSLFQAEARRCKNIIDTINTVDKTESHFCIFDELYSGTNPDEAIASAKAFMEYIIANKNVSCILTTHFNQLCKQLAKNKMIKNYHMETILDTNADNNKDFKYTYNLIEGISEIRGGIKVLKDMKYPEQLLKKVIE